MTEPDPEGAESGASRRVAGSPSSQLARTPASRASEAPGIRPATGPRHGVLLPILIIASWGFYAWFWRHGGQTLGMQAWKLLARDVGKKPMTMKQTVIRFFAGFSFIYLDPV